MENTNLKKMGWLKDYPDFRDHEIDTKTLSASNIRARATVPVKDILKKVNLTGKALKLPLKCDLRQWCSTIEDQGDIGSCTAHAGVGLLEYFENRAFGTHLNGSRLFLYKTTRNLLGWTGDTGAYLRTTMAAMALFGVPKENYWKYIVSRYDEEPTAFLYSFGQNYQALQYYRLDSRGLSKEGLLARIKEHLASGLPSMFGFTCYSSLNSAVNGRIPFPQKKESVVGGHAVIAVGFDDNLVITNGTVKTKGALLIRNSWGTGWGEAGYGYLPYEYVLRGLADDFWCLIKNEWIDTKHFGL